MRIYFDHNATTPVDPAVAEAMAQRARRGLRQRLERPPFRPAGQGPARRRALGGRRADRRRAVGDRVHQRRHRGRQPRAARRRRSARADRPPPPHRQRIEHEAVLVTLKALARRGWSIDASCPSTPPASSDPAALAAALTRRHRARLGDAREQRDRHDPADRRAGRAWRTRAARCSTPTPCSRSAKIPGRRARARRRPPVAVGAQVQRARRGPARCGSSAARALTAHMTGGKHERTRRAGTENVPGIVGLGVAARLARCQARARAGAAGRAARSARGGGPGARARARRSTARAIPRVPNTTNISFDGVEAESLLIALDLEGIAVSTGSACSSGTLEPSHVLRAMGLPSPRTQNSIRFSLGAGNTDEEVDVARSPKLPAVVDKLRSLTRALARGLTDARRSRDVRRRRFVGRRGVAGPQAGHDVDRSVDAALRSARTASDALRHLLHDRRPPRRPARRRPPRHPALHRQFRARVQRDTWSATSSREYAAGPNADSVRALQRRPEVRDPGRAGGGLRGGRRGDRATTRASSCDPGTGRLSAQARASIAAKDQSYFLFTLTQAQLAHAAFPVGASRQGRRCERRHARSDSAGRRQARQPRDLLRRRTAITPAFVERHGGAGAGGRDPRRRRRGRRHARRRASLHRRPAQGARPLLPHPALRRRHRRRAKEPSPSARATRSSDARSRPAASTGSPARPPSRGMRVTAQIRHRHREAAATITPLDDDRVQVEFDTPQSRRRARSGGRVLRRRGGAGRWVDRVRLTLRRLGLGDWAQRAGQRDSGARSTTASHVDHYGRRVRRTRTPVPALISGAQSPA